MTTQLSCHVQKIVENINLSYDWYRMKFPSNLNYDGKIVSCLSGSLIWSEKWLRVSVIDYLTKMIWICKAVEGLDHVIQITIVLSSKLELIATRLVGKFKTILDQCN